MTICAHAPSTPITKIMHVMYPVRYSIYGSSFLGELESSPGSGVWSVSLCGDMVSLLNDHVVEYSTGRCIFVFVIAINMNNTASIFKELNASNNYNIYT